MRDSLIIADDAEQKRDETMFVGLQHEGASLGVEGITISPTMLPRAPQTTRQCYWNVRTASRPIAESTAPSMNIGGLLTATDFHLGDSLTYSLTGADAGCFDIVSASGQLRTKSGADYDYETRSSYNVIVYNVIVTIDDEQDIATIVVSITVTAISKNSNAIAT